MKLFDKLIKRKNLKYPWESFYDENKRTVDIPNISVYEHLVACGRKYEDEIALNYFNKKMTFKSFFENINYCAKGLKKQGIKAGDVVSICMANTPEAVISFYAVNKIGAISNMIHPLSAEEEIKQSLISTNSVMLIAINITYSKVKNIIKDTPVYKTVIVSASDSMPLFLSLGYYLTQGRKIEVPKKDLNHLFWKDFMNIGKTYPGKVLIKTSKDQPAVILHSGGTTGTPKNIVLTNGNINAVAKQAEIILPEININDSMLTIMPLFHCFGLVVCVHAPLCLGASNILIPQFDSTRFDKLLTKYKPTLVAGVPTLYEALMHNKYMENVDLSLIKYIVSGGDSLIPAKQEALNEFLKNHNCFQRIIQGYGMTETTGPVTFALPGTDELGSVGIPLPGNKIKIIDNLTKEEVKYGVTGEILISGPIVMSGYLDNEVETNQILELDENNEIWVHTGDLGYMNEKGILFFAQRLKRMLIVSGYNVYPSHIEDVIMNHPAVLNCGVIGEPHPYKQQVPKAFIVLKSDVTLDGKLKKDIKDYCEKNLSHYMVPAKFEFRKSLPKTMIGKVNYRELESEKK